jgi:hypothetical protein
MKSLMFLSFITLILSNCTKNKVPQSDMSTSIYTVADITDRHLLQPEAIPILSLYNFNEYPDQSGVFAETYFSDKLLNPIYKCLIAEGKITEINNSNNDRHYREHLIRTFYDSVTITIGHIKNICDTSTELNTECFSTISRQLAFLIKEKSEKKILLVYSNLFENTETFSCYRKECLKLLESYPDSVASLLNHTHPLPSSLKGIRVYFIYKPISRQDDALYAHINAIYIKLLEQRQAQVFTQAQNSFIDK